MERWSSLRHWLYRLRREASDAGKTGARFVPVVRTFAPIVAGVGNMKYRTFVAYNVVGGLVWGAGITTLGYFLGEVDAVKNNIEIASVAIVVVSILPVVLEFVKHRRQANAAE